MGEIITTWTNQISGDFDISGMLAVIDFDDPSGYFPKQWLTGGVWAFYQNFDPAMDALYEKQLFMTDREERLKIARTIDKWAMEESGMGVIL